MWFIVLYERLKILCVLYDLGVHVCIYVFVSEHIKWQICRVHKNNFGCQSSPSTLFKAESLSLLLLLHEPGWHRDSPVLIWEMCATAALCMVPGIY